MGFGVRMRLGMRMMMKMMLLAWVSVFYIPCTDVDVADLLRKTSYRNVYKMAYCIRLPAYVR